MTYLSIGKCICKIKVILEKNNKCWQFSGCNWATLVTLTYWIIALPSPVNLWILKMKKLADYFSQWLKSVLFVLFCFFPNCHWELHYFITFNIKFSKWLKFLIALCHNSYPFNSSLPSNVSVSFVIFYFSFV